MCKCVTFVFNESHLLDVSDTGRLLALRGSPLTPHTCYRYTPVPSVNSGLYTYIIYSKHVANTLVPRFSRVRC